MLCTVIILLLSYQTNRLQFGTCSAHEHHVNSSQVRNSTCTSFRDELCHLSVGCRIRQTEQLGPLLPYKNIVQILDLSENHIDRIEKDIFLSFQMLITLNVSNNNIVFIRKNAFKGLRRLQTLDLSFNLLVTLDTDVMKDLPSLTKLDVTSNPLSSTSINQFASLPNLRILIGLLSYSEPFREICIRCSLIKHYYSPWNIDQRMFRYQSHCSRYLIFPRANLSTFWRSNFSISCQEISGKLCSKIRSKISFSPFYSVHISHLCWQEIKRWTLPNIPIGFIAVSINLVTMLTIMSSETLRNNVAMFLITNMAMGDFLQGLYLVALTATRHVISATAFFESLLSHNQICSTLLVVFVIAQSLSVLVGFLIVLERYLCIVFSMKPDIRITMTIAKLLVIVVWIASIIASLFPLVFKMYLTTDEYSCINVRMPNDDPVTYVTYLAFVGGSIYALSFVLYTHIFYTVKKSSLHMGIQRDVKLAKRILLVISSNLFFFLVPSIILHFFVGFATVHNRVYLFAIWHSVGYTCLGINGILNPLLYAFRNDKFRSELKKKLRCRSPQVGIVDGDDGHRN